MTEKFDNTKSGQEYLTEKEAKAVKELFQKCLKSYEEKSADISDKEWLAQLLRNELPNMSDDEIESDADEIMKSINTFDENLASCNQAAQYGISKEKWLANKIEESSVGMSVVEYGNKLQQYDEFLYTKNVEISDALSRSSDGHIMMSPNLDGNIAENMISKTTE